MHIDPKDLPPFLRLSRQALKDGIEKKIAALKKYFGRCGYSRAVIGFSGGIDSAVAAALGVRALGAENVFPISLPFRHHNDKSNVIAAEIAAALGIGDNLFTVDITPAVSASYKACSAMLPPTSEKEMTLRLGNLAARERMKVLMDAATHYRALLLGTENRTEHLLAYYTIGGDNVSNVEPIQDLWKAQVFQYGAALGLPASVLDRAPSAELWEGQTDEGEIGVSYRDIDTILAGLRMGLGAADLAREYGVQVSNTKRVREHVNRMAGKRRAPYRLK